MLQDKAPGEAGGKHRRNREVRYGTALWGGVRGCRPRLGDGRAEELRGLQPDGLAWAKAAARPPTRVAAEGQAGAGAAAQTH